MDKYLTLTVLLLLVLAIASDPLDAKRSKCRGTTVGNSGNCPQSNTSFFKRIYEAYKRSQVDEDMPERREWGLDTEPNYQKRTEDLDTVEEKLRLLNQILEELELDDEDMK